VVSVIWLGSIGFENRRFGFFEDPGKIVMTSEERRFQKTTISGRSGGVLQLQTTVIESEGAQTRRKIVY
jgi:hypothetical protein